MMVITLFVFMGLVAASLGSPISVSIVGRADDILYPNEEEEQRVFTGSRRDADTWLRNVENLEEALRLLAAPSKRPVDLYKLYASYLRRLTETPEEDIEEFEDYNSEDEDAANDKLRIKLEENNAKMSKTGSFLKRRQPNSGGATLSDLQKERFVNKPILFGLNYTEILLLIAFRRNNTYN